MNMRKVARTAICALSFVMSAGAALAQSGGQVPDWSGAYAGASLGYVIADIEGDFVFPPGGGAAIPYETAITSLTISAHGGYNYQFNDFVVGGEIDIGYPFDGEVRAAPGRLPGFEMGWSGHARARAGYLIMPDVLAYGAVGLAVAQFEGSRVPAAGTPTTTDSDTLLGLSLGAGVEFVPVEDIRIRAEYMWDNYFDHRFAGPGTFGGILFPALDSEIMTHSFRLGFTYYFN